MNRISSKDVVWRTKPRGVLVLAVFVCVVLIRPAHAFSAHLSRPWEIPHRQTPSHEWRAITRRRRRPSTERRQDAKKQQQQQPSSPLQAVTSSSSIEGATLKDDDEDSTNDDDDEEEEDERMTLDDDTRGRVFVMHAANSTSAAAAEVATTEESQARPSVRKLWRPLLAMCRPTNFAGVVLFHLLGTKLAVERIPNVAFTARLLFATLAQPSMVAVLIALLFTSATSMVVNDYYDTKSGVDSKKPNKPLVDGEVPMRVAKRFLTGLYACLMVLVAVIPGIPARLSVVVGLMMTFWYTRHLKPITWLKNGVCASVIALSPCTSGAAAYQLISGEQWGVLRATKLWRLAAMLFFGFLGREMVMDCNDVKDDKLHKVLTVPVVYGRRFTSAVSLACIFVMGLLGVVGASSVRQISLAAAGGLIMLFRHWQVFRTEGSDPDVVVRAIEEGKSTILLLLASYV